VTKSGSPRFCATDYFSGNIYVKSDRKGGEGFVFYALNEFSRLRKYKTFYFFAFNENSLPITAQSSWSEF